MYAYFLFGMMKQFQPLQPTTTQWGERPASCMAELFKYPGGEAQNTAQNTSVLKEEGKERGENIEEVSIG